MSSKDMFRKEQRFSFRKFSFGLASAVIANVIFGGAIANTPVVHANTTTETAAVATSERIASIPYTVNIVDQAGKVVETKEKKVLVYTVETIATATEYLTADLVPEGYAIVSGLGEVTLTEKADNIFTVKVDKIAPEAAAPTTTAESATSETSTAAATPEPASLTATQPTPVTSEVAEAEVAPTTPEESAKPTERTAYLSYITHYVNEANETVDRTGHLVAVTTTDETAKTQVTVSASENMPSGWELVQDKAKVVVQLVENQTNILVFAVTKKSKEEEIAESQLSNRDVLMRLSLEADLLADEALRQVAKEQAGNTALETAANETKAVAATANEVLANTAATEAELDDQIDTVRTSTQNLAAEMLKVDKDGILTAMLDATTQGITITTSSTGAVRPDYPNHIRDFATNNSQQSYNDQDFFFGLIGKALTQEDSQIRATAEAADGSNPSISLVGGGGQPLTDANNYGLQINNSGVIYGTTTITVPGNTVSWQFQAQNGSDTARKQFTFVPYTVVKTDENPVRKGVTQGVTADEILAKVKSDVTHGDGSTQGPLNAAFEEYFNTTLTARATGKSTTVTQDAKNGKQIWHEIVGNIPTTAGEHTVTVRSTNVHGQTIENTVKVVLNAAPTITASGTGSTNPFNTTNPERKIVYIFGITTGDTEAVTTAKAETGEKAKAPIFDRDIAQPVATITDADSTSIKVEYGDNAPNSRFNNLGSNMVATAADGTVLRDTKGNSTNVTVTDGTAKIYLGGTYEYLPGGKFTRQFIISDESNAVVRGEAFYTVSYTDKLKDDTPIAKNQDVALTKKEVVAKLTLDAQSGGFSDTSPTLTVPDSEVTRTIVGYRTADGVYTEQTNLAQFPKDKDFEVKVKTTNIYGQTVYNWVSVDYNLKPKVEIVDAVGSERKTVYVFSKNSGTTENSAGETGTNVTFNRDNATKAVVNITDDGQVTRIVYNDARNDTADMLEKGVTPATLVGTDGYFEGSVAAPAGTNATRLLKVTDDKGLVGQSPTFRVYAFSDTVPADVTVRLAKGTRPALEEITGKMVIDSNSGYPNNAKEAIPEDAYTRTVVGYRLDGSQDTVAVDSVEKLPTDGSYKVRVKTSNAYGQEIYNWVPVSHYKLEEVSRETVNKYTDFPAPIHAITELGSSGTVGTVKLEGDLPEDFNIANFNLKEGEAAKLAERNLEFVKADAIGQDGTVGTIRPKDGGKVEYTGSGNLDYVFEYNYQVNNENKTSNLTYTILYTDTQAPVMTPKSEYIRFVNEKYDISVPGTDNAFLSTEKINGTLSVLKDGESGRLVSSDLGTNTAITSELDPKGVDVSGGVDNQGGNSTMFNVNITGTAPSAEGTGTYKLRVGENNYPAPPTVSNKPENVRLTDIKVTFVKRAEMTTPVAVVDPANLTADEKAAVIAQLKKDNADNEKLNALPDTAFTVNADGTVSVDYSAGNADVDAVKDKVANATVKLADAQNEAKAAIDTKLAEEKAAIEAKRDEAIAEINNTPGLTDDQKKAATDAVTNTANDALTDLQTAADDAKKAIDTETTVAGINDAKTAGEKALDDATAKGEAAIELTKEKELAKADVDNQAKTAIEAIKNNPNLDATEQAPYIEAIEKAAEEQKAAIDKAKDTAGITDAVNAAEKVNEEQKLAAAKEDAKDKIAEEAAAAKEAIDNNPNLSGAEKTAAKDAVDTEVAKANDAIDKATTPETVQAAEDNGVKAIDAEELVAAKQDAKNKIAEDVKAAKDAIDKDPNLSEDEKKGFKDAVDTEAAKAVADIEKATTPAEAQTAEEAGTAAIAEDVLDAAKQDAKNKIAKDVEAANAAIESNPNLTDAEKQAAKDAVDAEVAKANDAIDAATKADEVETATLAGEKALAKEELKAAAEDAKKAIDANDNLTDAEKQAAKDAVDAELAKANDTIDAATTAEEVETATLDGEKALVKEEIKAAAEDAKKAIDAAKQGAKNKLMEEADKAKAAIDANPNLTPEEKAAAKAEIDKAVEEAIIAINGAGTHHALGEIKLPLSALIKPVVTVTPVLDPNNLTEEEIARIKALLEENNTFPEGTEIIISKGASVSIKYPDGTIDLVLPAEIVKQADTTAPAITDDAKGNIVVAPSEEAVELVVTYVDNNGKAQLVVVTKGADGKWTTTDKVVIVDPVTGQVIIPGSAIKPGTVVTAYSKDMAGNVSDLNSAEVEAVDANNPAAGVKVKSVTSTSNANKSTKKAKQLPNTGEKATSATSLGLAVLGMGLALFAAKRKKDEEEA
ncbi:DUF1542 domain-containing protein [Streptococcus suis]|nr:DUF1542 domain-containing protein [Streptococcus suis]